MVHPVMTMHTLWAILRDRTTIPDDRKAMSMEKLAREQIKGLIVSLIPALITFGFNCFVYIVPKYLISPERYIFLDMEIDRHIPFIPQFVIIYYLSFLQWLNYYLQASFGPVDRRNRYFSADMLAKAISFVIFLAWPVAMRWPDLSSDGNIWIKILSFTYGVDMPTRAFPSLHCFYSWISFRYGLETLTGNRRWIVCLQGIFSFALFAATTLVKQHYFIDVIGGIAVAELALQISARTALPDIFGKAMERISSRFA